MISLRISRGELGWLCALAFTVVLPACAGPGLRPGGAPSAERIATLQRRGAGVMIGAWGVQDLQGFAGASFKEWPALEGYFQRGLDLHLTMGNTIGLWRRQQELAGTGEVTSYVVPMFTSIRAYPVTRPEQRFEPYIEAGVGAALGIEDREGVGGALPGESDGTSASFGLGFRGGLGLEWRFSRAFGVGLNGRYQWVRLGNQVGGDRTFRGLGFDAGLTYRFQYD